MPRVTQRDWKPGKDPILNSKIYELGGRNGKPLGVLGKSSSAPSILRRSLSKEQRRQGVNCQYSRVDAWMLRGYLMAKVILVTPDESN